MGTAWLPVVRPEEDSQIAAAVVVENSGQGWTFAAPICRQVMEAFFFGPPPAESPEEE